jgi:simple sugar transport system permease protein
MNEILLPFLAAILGGALRVGVPFLFVSLGECWCCRPVARSAART